MPKYTSEQLTDWLSGPPKKAGQKKLEDFLHKKIPKPEKLKIAINEAEAKELLGADCLGKAEIEKAFHITLEEKDIPPIPFSEEELIKAKELGQFLILRVSNIGGEPLTMKKMNETLEEEFATGNKGKIFYNTNDYKNEKFFTSETPVSGWALTSKEVIPNSTSKNYLEQTQTLVDYLSNQVFKDKTLPPEYQEAIEEFNAYVSANFANNSPTALLGGDNWKKYTQELSDLKINKILRQTPAEILYDVLVYFQNNGQRLLENMTTWTSRRSSVGRLVGVGEFDAGGADVYGWVPGIALGNLGVSFSRSLKL